EFSHEYSRRGINYVVRRGKSFTIYGTRSKVEFTTDLRHEFEYTRILLNLKFEQVNPEMFLLPFMSNPQLKVLRLMNATNKAFTSKMFEFWINLEWHYEMLGPTGMGLHGKFAKQGIGFGLVSQAMGRLANIM